VGIRPFCYGNGEGSGRDRVRPEDDGLPAQPGLMKIRDVSLFVEVAGQA